MKLTRSGFWSSGAAIALLAGAFVLTAPLAASAEDPVDLAGAYVVDTVGATAGDEAQMQSALDDLYDRTQIQLFAVFVDSFTNPSDAGEWADAVAIDNNLGRDDVLLAVATGDRVYATSVDAGFRLSDAQLTRVEQAIEAQLVDDDWSGAVVAGAEALEVEATGVVGPNVPTDPATPAASGTGWILPVAIGGVVVVGGAIFIYSRIRKRNQDGAVTANPEGMTQEELDRRAGTLLVQLDDSVKSSEQELGFAVAQFGETATADFTAVLASAKQKVQQAFELQQQLDDVNPETAEQKRAMTTQIIQLCESADAELDAQADAFDELRQLEQNAPQELAEVRADATKVAERKAAAAAALAALSATYADSAVKPVAGNLEQADKLLTFAEAAAKKADAELAAGKASDAAIAVRTAQASVGQVGQLFDAIDALSASLGEASAKLDAAVADTQSDIAAAKALPQDAKSAALAPAIAAAESALAEAAKAKGDPLATATLVATANSSLDQVFTSVRDEQDRILRAKSQLESTISSARSAIQARRRVHHHPQGRDRRLCPHTGERGGSAPDAGDLALPDGPGRRARGSADRPRARQQRPLAGEAGRGVLPERVQLRQLRGQRRRGRRRSRRPAGRPHLRGRRLSRRFRRRLVGRRLQRRRCVRRRWWQQLPRSAVVAIGRVRRQLTQFRPQ